MLNLKPQGQARSRRAQKTTAPAELPSAVLHVCTSRTPPAAVEALRSYAHVLRMCAHVRTCLRASGPHSRPHTAYVYIYVLVQVPSTEYCEPSTSYLVLVHSTYVPRTSYYVLCTCTSYCGRWNITALGQAFCGQQSMNERLPQVRILVWSSVAKARGHRNFG